MRFYFYIAFYKGGNIGGHNCTKFEIKKEELLEYWYKGEMKNV